MELVGKDRNGKQINYYYLLEKPCLLGIVISVYIIFATAQLHGYY